MLFEDTYNIFKTFSQLDNDDYMSLVCTSNGKDCILDGDIPDSYISTLRSNFQLHVDEEILMFRDTSFWDSEDQGTVVTDWGITIIEDNNNPEDLLQLSWEKIHHVEKKGDHLIFFLGDDRNDNAPVHLSYFVKDEDDYAEVGDVLASLFTDLAQSQLEVSPMEAAEAAIAQWSRLREDGKMDEALQVLLQYRNDYNTVAVTSQIAAHLSLIRHDNHRALEILDEDIQALDEEQLKWKTFLTWCKINTLISIEKERLLHIDKSGNALKKAQETKFAYLLAKHRELCLYVAQKSPEDNYYSTSTQKIKIKDDSANDFRLAENYLQEHILEQPYKDRKLIVPVDRYTTLDQQTLTAIHIDRLGKLDFPMGHPVVNHLYVGHPLIPSKYIPFEDYELELLEDRVREFCVLVQSLGATSITIECINANSDNEKQSGRTKTEGKIKKGFVAVGGSYVKDANSRFLSEISRKFNLHQEFSPKKAPYIPEGMIWYANEPSWQRLADQRMKGTLNVHIERIETRKNQVVETSEFKKISAELQVLSINACGSWEKSSELMFESHESVLLAIHVEFAPIERLVNSSAQQTEISQPLSPEEQEYADELRECLNNNGIISDSERRLLNKYRSRLGISEARARELEAAMSKPQLQLTADEQEYLSEYKEAIADGELSAVSRKLLRKLQRSMGISDERAEEIENSIN